MFRWYHWQGDRKFLICSDPDEYCGCVPVFLRYLGGFPFNSPLHDVVEVDHAFTCSRRSIVSSRNDCSCRNGAQTRKRERGYTHTMLAVRRHPEDCSYLPLLGTAGGATWWQVSESKWACPRGMGLGFRRESRATAGPRDRRFDDAGPAACPWGRTILTWAAACRDGEYTLGDARARVSARGESGNVNCDRDRVCGSTAI